MGMRLKGLFFVALVAACVALAWPTFQAYRPGADPTRVKNKVNLGLDLQGGMFLDLEVEAEAAADHNLDRLAQELEDALIEKHVDYLGVDRKPGAVVVRLAQAEKAPWEDQPFKRMLSNFETQPGEGNSFSMRQPPGQAADIAKRATDQAIEVIRNRIDSLGVSEPSLQKQGDRDIIVQLPGLKDRAAAIQAIGTQAVLEFYLVDDSASPSTMDPGKDTVLYQEVRDADNRLVRREPFVLERRPVLSGETVRDARVAISSRDNRPYVSISFDATGADQFERVTRRNTGRRLAIVLDNKVQSAPVIREAISGGEAQISGQFTMAEATNLSIVLRSGALPAPLVIREERAVGASLGEDSIHKGLLSLIVGGVLVVAFMLVYYRLSGVFASLALVLNMLLIVVALAWMQATLTLPGIAGIVLTLAMALDANVLIFERIREELLKGTAPRTAIEEGFRRAFWTIFDSNLTTLFGAFALLAFGTGTIKGFAITLAIGILASMFTAIYAVHYLFDLFYSLRGRVARVSI